jgi:hypothetical protein
VNTPSTYLNADENLSPKQKNQSTSPNLPLNEITISEEEVRIHQARNDSPNSSRSSLQESVTPTASIQPMIDEITNDDDAKKDDAISTSETATPPVQEIRYQSNQFVNSTNSSVTPTLSVMGYAPPPAFTAPLETGGAIYHTGVRDLNSVKVIKLKCS